MDTYIYAMSAMQLKPILYTYKAVCVNVVDGDTYDFLTDLGFGISYKIRVRLKDLDTAEMNAKSADEREHAKRATSYAEQLLLGRQVILKTQRDRIGIYGRYTASVTLDDGRDLATVLKAAGLEKREQY